MKKYTISENDFRKFVIAVILFVTFAIIAFPSHAQTITRDSQGNYHSVKSVKTDSLLYKTTSQTYTDKKGVVYQLLISSTGRLFYFVTSKTGNQYKKYMPKG